MIVIGLSGHSSSGKDSVADILVRDHGFVKMSFAAPVKRVTRNANPIVGYEVIRCDCGGSAECPDEVVEVRLADLYKYGFDDETVKDTDWGDEVRDLWQRFATEGIRAEDPDFWVRIAQKDLLESGHERVVFSDVRFPNEAQMIYELNGPFFGEGELMFSPFQASVWQVSRLGVEQDEHESEQHAGLLEEEITIINDGTLDDLAEVVTIGLEYLNDGSLPERDGMGWLDNLIGAGDE